MSNVLQNTGGNTLKVHGGGVFGSAAAPVAPDADTPLDLAAGHYREGVPWTATAYASQVAASTTETVIYPRPDSEVLSSARHRWAHSQMDYQIPVCIRGGNFPHYLQLDETGTSSALVASAVIGVNHNSTDAYTITIPAATIAGLSTLTDYDVVIKATDQAGNELKVFWSFQKEAAERDHFFFVDNSYTGGASDGSFDDPFDSMIVAGWTMSGNGASSANKTLVLKEGNSQTTPYLKDGGWTTTDAQFPRGVIAMVGESPKIDLESARPMVALSGTHDYVLFGIEIINGQDATLQTGDGRGAFNNGFNSVYNRITFWNNTFDTVNSWGSSNVNPGALIFDGNFTPAREHLAIVDCTFKNFAGTSETNSGAPIHLMMFYYFLIDNCKFMDNGSTSGCAGMVYLKHGTGNGTIRRSEAYDNNYWRRSVIHCDDTNNAVTEVENMEYIYNNTDNEHSTNDLLKAPGTNSSGDGPHYVFRNTARNSTLQVDGDSTDSEAFGNILGSTDDSSVVWSVDTDNYESVSETNQEVDGTLKAAYLTSITKARGTVGHEIA